MTRLFEIRGARLSSIIAALLTGCFAMGLTGRARAETVDLADEPSRRRRIDRVELSDDERQWIEEHPIVRAYFEPWPPFLLEADGEEAGITVDYVELIAAEVGLEIEWVHMEWSEALRAVRERRDVDLLPILTHNEEREAFLEFTESYLSFPIVIFTREDASSFVGGLDDLSGRRIAVERDYAMHDRLSSEHPDLPLVVVGTTEEALEAVSTGRADAYIGNLAVASYLIRRRGLANLEVAGPSPFGTHDQAMGVRRDWAPLARILDRGLRAVTADGHAEIRQRWLALRVEPGISPEQLRRMVGWTIAGVGFILLIVGFWLWRLRREVATRRMFEAEVVASRALLQRRHADVDDLVASIAQSLEELITVSEELHGVAQEIDGGASRQAAAVGEVQRTIEALAQSSGAIADATIGVSRHAQRTVENQQAIAAATEALFAHARRIEQLLTVIRDTADKSDLLALNAALEAARAGEAGRAFSEVADQLQRLATRTVGAVGDIEDHVEAVRLGTSSSSRASAEGLDRALETRAAAQRIEETTQHQRVSTEQVARSIDEIGGVAAKTALGSTYLVELAATLSGLATQLQQAIERNRAPTGEDARLSQPEP